MKNSCLLICFVVLSFFQANCQTADFPHLEERGGAKQLIVHGQPYLILGGELLNSSSSNAAFMQPIWPRLKAMHLNTVLAAVSWELIEPTEGNFDFTSVDSMLAAARSNNLHLVLLWFGTWKNGLSHYVPEWMKIDTKRFPRMHIGNNKAVEAVTPLCDAAMQADSKAFAALIKHLKNADAVEQTVLMIQVENEVGLIGGPRDLGELANQKFAQAVPTTLFDYLQKNKADLLPETQKLWSQNGYKTSGTWQTVFGTTNLAQEAFMGWQYAQYINKVTEAGKAQYALPMFVNTWIVQPEDKQPGDYPSGGPQAHMHDIWRAGAPKIDLLCPDIYLPDFDTITTFYTRSNNSIFVPESFSGLRGAANAFYAIGAKHSIGYSPFGIDRGEHADTALMKAYTVLEQLAPTILSAQNNKTITGIWLNKKQMTQKIQLGNYMAEVSLRHNFYKPIDTAAIGYGIVIQTGPNELIVAGQDIQMYFTPTAKGPAYVGYVAVDEGTYKNGKWIAGRRLNGDEIMHTYNLAEEAANGRTGAVVRLMDEPSIYHVKLYRFE